MNAQKNFWKKVWSLNVPSKIQHFIWRACIDSFPTKLNLSKRIPIPNAICERCGSEIEDTVHALWGCQKLKELWWNVEQCRSFLTERFVNFRDLFEGVMLLDSHNIAEIMAFIAWSIWFNRNALRVGSHTLPITQIHREALERLQEFQAAIDPPLHIPTVLHPAHWLPPLP